MGEALQAIEGALQPSIRRRTVLKLNLKGAKTECLFVDGTSILLSNFLAGFVRTGDELLFPLELQAAGGGTQIYICNTSTLERRKDAFQAEIGYATQPRKDKRGNLFVSAEVVGGCLGLSAIHLGCEALRDYFYVGNRRRARTRQTSLYELLRVNTNVAPAELRLAFKLRTLELRAARAPAGELRALERAFNILAHPELRACYDALLNDPAAPALFPYSGFGSLLVAGDRSRDGTTFYASRILSFLPDQKTKRMQVPLRKCTFYDDRAIYRDGQRKCEIMFDQSALPLSWDSAWNQWKHLLGAKITIRAAFIQSGKYQRRGEAWHLVRWETALPSRMELTLPVNIAEQTSEARQTHHRFGQFADALDRIRARTESAPIERADLQKLCADLGIPGDFDVALITWKADYDAFYYRQLCKRARRLYLFRSEYIFDFEKAVIVEIPQLGHATYLFSKRASMTEFLALYTMVTREDILQNRSNVAEKLGFLGRIIHGVKPPAWLKELKVRLGEVVDYADISE
ncbi:MAG: hypothetical protein ACRD4X_02745 [Candidatus Acidiferrales bacterium]